MNNTELIAQARWYADKIPAYGDYAKGAADVLRKLADALEAAQQFAAWSENPYTKVLQKSIAEDYVPKEAQSKEPMVTPYISQAHFDRVFPGTAAQQTGEPWRKPGDDIPIRPAPQVPMTENQIDSDLAKVISDYPNVEGSSVEKLNWYKSLYRRAEAHHKIGVKP